MVSWPEIQDYMEHPRWNECIFCTEIEGHPCPDSTYMIPEDLYDEVNNKFIEREIETNLGLIHFTEFCAIVNNGMYFYDRNIHKNDKVLLYMLDYSDQYIITTCISAAKGFPHLFEDSTLLEGVNCEIIGSRPTDRFDYA